MKVWHVLAVVAMVATPTAAGTTVYSSHLRQQAACDGRHAIVDAFEIHTNVLVAALNRPGRTPAEQKRFDRLAAKFRADLAEQLAPLLEGC